MHHDRTGYPHDAGLLRHRRRRRIAERPRAAYARLPDIDALDLPVVGGSAAVGPDAVATYLGARARGTYLTIALPFVPGSELRRLGLGLRLDIRFRLGRRLDVRDLHRPRPWPVSVLPSLISSGIAFRPRFRRLAPPRGIDDDHGWLELRLLPQQDERRDQQRPMRQRRQCERNRTTAPPYLGSLEHGSPRGCARSSRERARDASDLTLPRGRSVGNGPRRSNAAYASRPHSQPRGVIGDGAGDVEPRGQLQSLEARAGIDLQHLGTALRLQQIHARDVEAENARGPHRRLGVRGRQIDRRPFRSPVDVAAELALLGLPPHRPDHLIAHYPPRDVAAARFGDELLQQDLLPEVPHGGEDALHLRRAVRDHHADALRPLD